MDLQLNDYREGAHAIVLFNIQKSIVYKVFKSCQYPNISNNIEFSERIFNDWKRDIYISEKTAYELISTSNISQYFPKYYSGATINKVFDKKGFNVSNQFLLDCVLTLDLIPGKDYKQNTDYVKEYCRKQNIDLEQIFKELVKIGVNFWNDSSIFCNENSLKIIDIATKNFMDLQPYS